MIKGIVCDLDGTLLTNKKQLLERTVRGLINAQQQGYKLVIASSRSYFMVEEIAEKLQLAKYGGCIVNYNGLIAYNAVTKEKRELHAGIPDALVNKLFDFAKAYRQLLVFESDKGMQFHVPFKLKWALPLYYYLKAKKKYKEMRKLNFQIFGDFRFNPDQSLDIIASKNKLFLPVLKCGYIHIGKNFESVLGVMRQHFNDELEFVPISRLWCDIMLKGVNKAQGVKLCHDWLGFGLDEMIAFGDGENDYELLQQAQIGVMMKNGCDKLKSVTDYTTLSNNENGVVHGLLHYNIIEN